MLEFFLGCRSGIPINFRSIFTGQDRLWFFFAEGRGTYQIENIMLPRISWEDSSLSRFPPREKIPCFWEKKYHHSRWCKKDHVPARSFLKRQSFQNIWRKYHISVYFFWERPYFIFRQGVRSYFREKETSSFLIIQERSNSSAIFLERPSFQDVWKKKIWFSVQWKLSPRVNQKMIKNSWKEYYFMETCFKFW